MAIFKSKAEKEQEKKMLVKRSMNELRKRISKLEGQEKVYVEQAKIAIREELPEQIKLAKQALKLTVAERKRTYQMLLNAEIISQMKDMTAMTTEFLQAVQVLSRDIAKDSGINTTKVQQELRVAMGKVAENTENLEELLVNSQDDITDFSSNTEVVTDSDIDKMIFGGDNSVSDADIDKDIEAIRSKLR